MAEWSELFPDLLALISRRLDLVEDFVAFRGVCTSWRAAARKQIFINSWPTVPLLMLAEKEDRDDREFYSLSRREIWRNLSLPKTKKKKCMESRGWLITVGIAGEMNLLHPLSGTEIELPHQTTFPRYNENATCDSFVFLRRAVLSASASSSPDKWSDFVLMVVYNGGTYLGFWRSGDKCWTGVEKHYRGAFSDVNFYNGKFYAIAYNGNIYVCDVFGPAPTEARLVLRIDRELLKFRDSYLVESAGELLVVARDGTTCVDDDGNYGATNFRVIQLGLTNRKCKGITSLGDSSIFLGYNAAFSVEAARFPGIIKPNCIYFTDDCIESHYCSEQGGGKDMGIYNLEDGKIERLDDIRSFSFIGPPVWVALSF